MLEWYLIVYEGFQNFSNPFSIILLWFSTVPSSNGTLGVWESVWKPECKCTWCVLRLTSPYLRLSYRQTASYGTGNSEGVLYLTD